MNRAITIGAAGLVALGALSPSAEAAFAVKFTSDPGGGSETSVTITDGGAGDASATAGLIIFDVTTLTGFSSISGQAVSKDVVGSSSDPELSFGTFQVTTGSSIVDLLVEVTDMDFDTLGSGPTVFTSSVTFNTGTTGLTAHSQAVVDPANGSFVDPTTAGVTSILDKTQTSPGGFVQQLANLDLSGAGDFSISFRSKISGFTSANQTADVDYTLQSSPVPIPAALPLFASALAGVSFIGWRRTKAS